MYGYDSLANPMTVARFNNDSICNPHDPNYNGLKQKSEEKPCDARDLKTENGKTRYEDNEAKILEELENQDDAIGKQPSAITLSINDRAWEYRPQPKTGNRNPSLGFIRKLTNIRMELIVLTTNG